MQLSVTACRAPEGAVDTILSYCHNNLADQTLLDLLPYLHEKGVGVISASFSSMGLLRKEVRMLLYQGTVQASEAVIVGYAC